MRDVVIVEAGRSPIGKKNGALSAAHPTELLGQVMMAVLERAGVQSSSVGQVVGGCINKVGAQAMSVTRTAWLTAGGAIEVACSTVDSQCGSSQFAVNLAASLIASGAEDVVLACGVENMSLLPIGSDAIAGAQASAAHQQFDSDLGHICAEPLPGLLESREWRNRRGRAATRTNALIPSA